MNGSEDPHELSLDGFARDAEAWATESPDDVSLSKYSIWSLVDLAKILKLKGVDLALYLRAPALKREHVGASRFIFWSFADSPPPDKHPHRVTYDYLGVQREKEPLHGIGAPSDEEFQYWLANKSSGASLTVPPLELPLLADYADEFLHLRNHLGSLSKEFDSTFLNRGGEVGGISMVQALDALVYFHRAEELNWLAQEVLKRAVAEHREDPVDLLLQAFEGIGVATERTLRSEDVAKS